MQINIAFIRIKLVVNWQFSLDLLHNLVFVSSSHSVCIYFHLYLSICQYIRIRFALWFHRQSRKYLPDCGNRNRFLFPIVDSIFVFFCFFSLYSHSPYVEHIKCSKDNIIIALYYFSYSFASCKS